MTMSEKSPEQIKKDHIRKKQAEWRKRNPELRRQYRQGWKNRNPEKNLEQVRNAQKRAQAETKITAKAQYSRWSADDIKYAMDSIGEITVKEIAKKLGRSYLSVSAKIRDLRRIEKTGEKPYIRTRFKTDIERKEANRIRNAEWRKRNPGYMKMKNREWRKRNPGRIRKSEPGESQKP